MLIENKFKITKFFLFLFIGSLFLKYIYASIALCLILIVFIFECVLLKRFKLDKSFLWFAILPLIYAFNIFYFGEIDAKVLDKFFRVVPIILFSILFSNLKLSSKELSKLLDFFLLSLILFCVCTITYVSVKYHITETRTYLLTVRNTILVGQVNVPKLFEFHTPYLSFYLLTGCVICYNKIVDLKKEFYIFVNVFLLVLLIYFTGRTSIFLGLILFFVLLMTFLKEKKIKKKHGVLIIFITILFLGFIFIKSPMLKEKVLNIFDDGFGIHQRMLYIKSAASIINDNWFFGLGLIHYQIELINVLPKGIVPNLHNQYMELLLSTGLMGLIGYLLLKIKILKKASYQNSNILLIFIIFFSLSELTESLLYRQRGVFLFSFFVSLLYYSINVSFKKIK